MRVALATCAALPELDPDDQLVLARLRELGVEAMPAIWDDASIDWAAFDLVVIRDTWDYTSRRAEFLSWARSVPRLANPADVVEWNTDKRYLADLSAAGLAVVPTSWISDAPVVLPAQGVHVLKPAIGAGSVDAGRFALHDIHEHELAIEHATRLLNSGRTVMVQPYIDSIESHGETGLIFVGGEFSHAITKGAMLAAAGSPEIGGLYVSEKVAATEPSASQLDLAQRALAAVPGGTDRLLYARVDLVPDANGEPLIMELELTEPSLFMATAPISAARFAQEITKHTA